MSELQWYEGPGTPDPIFWWAVEHQGHPAFYLRALMAGDFAPGAGGPKPRHVVDLEGELVTEVRCGTCELVPDPDDLEPIERSTGFGGFLGDLRRGRARWPSPTNEATCWECSDKRKSPRVDFEVGRGARKIRVKVCDRCGAALERRGSGRRVRRT